MTRQPTYHTITSAAKRVRRSPRSIERWIIDGLEIVEVKNANGTVVRRLIEEEALLAMYRAKLTSRRNDTPNGA